MDKRTAEAERMAELTMKVMRKIATEDHACLIHTMNKVEKEQLEDDAKVAMAFVAERVEDAPEKVKSDFERLKKASPAEQMFVLDESLTVVKDRVEKYRVTLLKSLMEHINVSPDDLLGVIERAQGREEEVAEQVVEF